MACHAGIVRAELIELGRMEFEMKLTGVATPGDDRSILMVVTGLDMGKADS